MASDAYKTLYGPAFLPAAAATITTIGGTVQWIIRRVVIINTDVVTRTCGLYVNGTTAQFQVTPSAMTIEAGGMLEIDCAWTIEQNGTLAGVASVANKLTITVCGDEYTF